MVMGVGFLWMTAMFRSRKTVLLWLMSSSKLKPRLAVSAGLVTGFVFFLVGYPIIVAP